MKKLIFPFAVFLFISPVFGQRASATARIGGPDAPRVEKTSSVSANSARAIERRAFDLVNAERQRYGMRPLAWSDDAAELARMHSRNMAQYHFFSHKGRDGSMVNDRAEQLGINDWRAIGENIAFNRGYRDPADFAFAQWLESSSHRENMLNREWNESAIGVAIAPDGSYYFTQVFFLKK